MKKESKIVIYPSDFWRDVISYVILIPLLILAIKWAPEKYDIMEAARFGAIMVTGMLILFRMGITHMCLDEAINWKFRIKKENKYAFSAKVLQSWFWFIPYWKPIKENFHTYKTQSFFGRKETGCYSTDVTFSTIEDAREAIIEYKKKAKEQRIAYFAKKKVEKFKTIKI
jgi:hypothetical protein